jgi:hypothetical protein
MVGHVIFIFNTNMNILDPKIGALYVGLRRPCHGSGSYLMASHRCSPGSNLGQVV